MIRYASGPAAPWDLRLIAHWPSLLMVPLLLTRGMMDEEGNQFVAYFLPVEETLKKRKRDQEEEMDYAPDDVCVGCGAGFGGWRIGCPFLPHEEAAGLTESPACRYDYKIAREYNWNVKNKASKGYEENYFFIFREGDGVYYNELETRYLAPSSLRLAWACPSESRSWCTWELPGSSSVRKDRCVHLK